MLRTAFLRLARRPVLVAGMLMAVGVIFSALPTLRYGPPLPALHDEYSYLLLGETLAHGRLTNDPPPGPPEFFETFHEIITPRYLSKYPPGQGIVLAAGMLLGSPIVGTWLVNGLWAAAIYWMFRGAAGPGWALAGAVAGIVGFGAMSGFSESYWGGSVMALGGTLAFGGGLRLWRGRGNAIIDAILAGTGCGIIALTRPFDGFVFALGPAVMVALSLWHKRFTGVNDPVVPKLVAFIAPAITGVGLMLAYNAATTGSPLLFAHQLYDRDHLPALTLFVWGKPAPNPPAYPGYLESYERTFSSNFGADPLTLDQYMANLKTCVSLQFRFLFPFWTLPLAALGLTGALVMRDPVARVALASIALIAVPLLALRFYSMPHYVAAWTAPALLLMIQGGRRLGAGWRETSSRRRLLQTTLALALLAAWPVESVMADMLRGYPQWSSFPWVSARAQVEQTLAQHALETGRRQLVAVVYPANHDSTAEWVFNSSDPAAQNVLWARARGPERIPELLRAFPQYDAWLAVTKDNGELDQLQRIKSLAELAAPPAQNNLHDGATKD